MKQTVQNIPFLRLTIALAVGILIGAHFSIEPKISLPILASIFVALFVVNINYRYSFKLLFGLTTQVFFIFTGIIFTQQHNKKPALFDNGNFIAVVLEKPQEKPKSYKSLLQIETVNHSDSITATKELVIVYFSKADSVAALKAGDIIVFNNTPQTVENSNNPYEFDYKNYLEKKKIYRQVYIPENKWIKTAQNKKSPIIWAEQTREKLLQIYRNQPIDEIEFEILSALTLGYKRELETETKIVFSASGASHVLAVSGLHVGVVYYLITILFGFLRYKKSGRILFMIIAITTLWGYAFITGLSPSVMRAATMFSIFAVGENLNRRANIYNSMAASAFLLLLINPNNLYDIGFQLSYAAVFGIVFLQPKLEKIILVRNRFLKFFWMLITVSISAQIATFPITSYYFGQFPTYFWLTNTFVIPAVMALIPLGIFLLFLSTIPVISTILSFLLNIITKITYFLLFSIYQLPFSVFDISIGQIQFILLIATVVSAFIFIKNQKATYFKAAFLFVFILFISKLFTDIKRLNNTEVIVYNSGKELGIQLIRGKTNYIITDEKLTNEEKWFHPGTITKRKLGLNPPIFLVSKDTVANESLFLKNGLVFFEGKTFSLNKKLHEINRNHFPDFIVNPVGLKLNEIDFKPITTIITNKRYFEKDQNNLFNIHCTSINGAFREKW